MNHLYQRSDDDSKRFKKTSAGPFISYCSRETQSRVSPKYQEEDGFVVKTLTLTLTKGQIVMGREQEGVTQTDLPALGAAGLSRRSCSPCPSSITGVESQAHAWLKRKSCSWWFMILPPVRIIGMQCLEVSTETWLLSLRLFKKQPPDF